MRRRLAELSTVLVVNAVIAASLAAANVALARPSTEGDIHPTGAVLGCLDGPVVPLAASKVTGGGGICLDDGGVHGTLRVGSLWPGDAYTGWLAYFDRPSTCTQSPCGLVDLRGNDPPGVVVRIGGGVPREDGELELRADLPDLRLTAGSQVTLLLLNHGPASETDNRARARQLLTLQRPDLGAPVGGAVADGGKGWPHAEAVLFLH
ncbi:MAG: hypothetical protein U0893_24960 [Chloroflexota bacterium]